MPPRKRLGQLLTELGVVDEHQLQSALGHQKQWGGKLGAVLVQKGFCKESEVVIALSKHLGMPSVKLADAKIDPRAVKFVSKQIAEKLHVFPYGIAGSGRSEVVTVAMSDPTDLSAVDQLAFHTGKRIKPMLAGDSEIVLAIQEHYADEKKPAVAPPAGARPEAGAAAAPAVAPPQQAPEFPRRVAPPAAMTPSASTSRLTPAGGTPYIPPPIPVMAPKPAQKLEEIEPDESMSVPAKPEPLDLPPDDGQMMGLEPIAAHSQFGDAVAGQEEVAGEGSAADSIEGLESGGIPHEGADAAAQMDGLEPGAAQAQEPAPEGGWGEAAPAEGWQAEDPAASAAPAAEGWSEEAPASPAAQAPASDFGAAQDWSAAQEQAEGLNGEEPPAAQAAAAWGSEQGWRAEQPAESSPGESPGEELPMDAIIGTAEAVEGGQEASAWGDAAPAGEPAQEQAEAEAAADHQPSADAPDAWASSDDPLAAEAEVPASGEAAPPEQAWGDAAPAADNAEVGHVVAPSTDKFAPAGAAARAEEAPAATETEAPPEWGDAPAEESQPAASGEELAAAEEFAAPSEEFAGPSEEQGELKLEGWVAPLPEPEPEGAGWFGQALEATTPLSAADQGTLASVGVDPNDGVGALRLLATLVRVLHRHQLLDPDEVANEIRESQAEAAAERAAAEGSASGVAASGEPGSSAEQAPPAEPAET